MNNTFRFAAIAVAIASLAPLASAQTAETFVSNGVTAFTYGPTGPIVSPPGSAIPSLSSTVSASGSPRSSGLAAQPDITAVGSFTAGTLTSGFSNNGLLGTNAVLGDTTVTGDLTVTGTTFTNGLDNGGQVISNVAPGVAANDASTVGQLNAATAAQAITNASQAGFNNRIQAQTDANRRIASNGTAIVAAAASIPALEAGKNIGFGMGVGGYDGRGAISVALAARASQALQFKLHVGTGSGGKVAAGAGGLWSW